MNRGPTAGVNMAAVAMAVVAVVVVILVVVVSNSLFVLVLPLLLGWWFGRCYCYCCFKQPFPVLFVVYYSTVVVVAVVHCFVFVALVLSFMLLCNFFMLIMILMTLSPLFS